jgi:hypothetical protein
VDAGGVSGARANWSVQQSGYPTWDLDWSRKGVGMSDLWASWHRTHSLILPLASFQIRLPLLPRRLTSFDRPVFAQTLCDIGPGGISERISPLGTQIQNRNEVEASGIGRWVSSPAHDTTSSVGGRSRWAVVVFDTNLCTRYK